MSSGTPIKWRLFTGFVLNAVLAITLIRSREHLFDVRDYRYVSGGGGIAFLIAVLTTIALVTLLPVLRSSNQWHRWVAILMALLPLTLGVIVWMQLIAVAVAN